MTDVESDAITINLLASGETFDLSLMFLTIAVSILYLFGTHIEGNSATDIGHSSFIAKVVAHHAPGYFTHRHIHLAREGPKIFTQL